MTGRIAHLGLALSYSSQQLIFIVKKVFEVLC
jgi:hypothetical protein